MKKTIPEKSNIWIYGFSLLLLSTSVLPGMYLKAAVFALAMYGAWLTRRAHPSLLLLISSVLLDFVSSSSILILMTLPAYFGRSLLNMRMKVRTLIYILLTACALLLALFFGEDPNGRTMVLFMMCFFAFLSVANGECGEDELKAYAISGLMIVVVALIRSSAGGSDGLMSGRLSINGNIRTLANATATPLFLLLASMIGMVRQGKKVGIVQYAAVGMGVLILFATLSKGALIASAAGVGVLFLMARMPVHKKIIYALLLLLAAYFVFDYLSGSEALRTDRLMQNDEGFNGRTDIWLAYWREMTESAGRFLFGFGPGDILRMNISQSYSHSLFLDILFSYGVVGFVLVMGIFIGIWWQICVSKNAVAIGIAVFAALLYATHGVSTVSSFYILTGISASIARNRPATLPSGE